MVGVGAKAVFMLLVLDDFLLRSAWKCKISHNVSNAMNSKNHGYVLFHVLVVAVTLEYMLLFISVFSAKVIFFLFCCLKWHGFYFHSACCTCHEVCAFYHLYLVIYLII